MERLTHERCNGIKTGYWSPEKKESLVNALAEYENTELTPDQIQELKERDTAMQIKETHLDEYYCPACGSENNCNLRIVEDKFCPECGQRLKQREEQE